MPLGLERDREILEGDDRISLSRRVEVHDDTHVEVRLGYGLPLKDQGAVDYHVQIYFFFPGSLDVNETTFPKREFYQDIHAYLRFKTPELNLEELLDEDAPDSPLCRLVRLEGRITREKADPGPLTPAVVDEAKLFGCLARAYMQDKLDRVLPFIRMPRKAGGTLYDRDRLVDSIERFHGKSRALLERFRAVMDRYSKGQTVLPKRLTHSLLDTDEYLSYQYEKYFCRLLEAAQRSDDLLAERIRPMLVSGVRSEHAHRRERGYLTGPSTEGENEVYTNHVRLLKKFVESALYLGLRRQIPQDWVADWIGAFAAGLAMLFATVTSVLLQPQAARFADTWAIGALVLIYIFKDRIKEMVKRKLGQSAVQWLPDIDTRIIDRRSDAVLGRCRETTRWIPAGQVPEMVERVRAFHSMTHRDLREATGETVLRYDKKITLFPDRIQRAHRRRNDVQDILRFDVSDFLRHMDDPGLVLRTLAGDHDRVIRTKGRKTYSLNLVIAYEVEDGRPIYEKVRVVLDRSGVKRVETVLPPCPEEELRTLDSSKSIEDWIERSYAAEG